MCFSIHVTYYSAFKLLTFLSFQKFNDRTLFKPGVLCLICWHSKIMLRREPWEKRKSSPFNEPALLVKRIPKEKTCPREKRQLLILVLSEIRRVSFYRCVMETPITREKREENKFHKIPSKWTYNLSILKFILLHSRWREQKAKFREERIVPIR